jgi:hypothetical protein
MSEMDQKHACRVPTQRNAKKLWPGIEPQPYTLLLAYRSRCTNMS